MIKKMYGMILTVGDEPFPTDMTSFQGEQVYSRVACLRPGHELDERLYPTDETLSKIRSLINTLENITDRGIFIKEDPGALFSNPQIKIRVFTETN